MSVQYVVQLGSIRYNGIDETSWTDRYVETEEAIALGQFNHMKYVFADNPYWAVRLVKRTYTDEVIG